MKKILFTLALLLITSIFSVQTLKAATVNGLVLYQDDSTRPVNSVKVILRNVETSAFQTYTTGPDGYYVFNNVENGNYKITGTKTLPGGGVNLLDAFLVFLHINGFYPFTDMQFLGADVNGSGTITWTDYFLIMNHIRRGTQFPVGPWSFEISTFNISNLKEGIPKGIGGTCSGDVGGTFVPTINNTPALPIAQVGEINISSGENFSTRIVTHEAISFRGAGLIINYPADLLQIESIDFKGFDYEYSIENGQIKLIWGDPNTALLNYASGETLLSIHGICTPEFKKGMTASLSFDGNTCLINASNEEITKFQLSSPVLKGGGQALKLHNYPNPFKSTTKLCVYTPEDGIASVVVYNASGQVVKTIMQGNITAGNHEIILDASQMTSGYYICKLFVKTADSELSNTIRILKTE